MDSFEFNKIAAAVLIALLIVKGADLISEALIHPKMLKENVYKIEGIETAAQPGAAIAEKKGPAPIEPLLASANVEKGAEIFKKCMSCHTAEKGGPNKIGPDLYNVVGAPRGKHPGYTYSQAMEQKGGSWTYDDLNVYLYSPRDFVPGTKMSFAGLKNDQDRADVIAYLHQQSDNPLPLPKAQPAPAEKSTAPQTQVAPPSKPASGAEKPAVPQAQATPPSKPALGAEKPVTPQTQQGPVEKLPAQKTPEAQPTSPASTKPLPADKSTGAK